MVPINKTIHTVLMHISSILFSLTFLFSGGCGSKIEDEEFDYYRDPEFGPGGHTICWVKIPFYAQTECELIFDATLDKKDEFWYYPPSTTSCDVVEEDSVKFMTYDIVINYDGSVIEKVKVDGPDGLGGEWNIEYPTTGTDTVVCKGAWGDGTGDYDYSFILDHSGKGSELSISINEADDRYFPAIYIYQNWKVIITERLMGGCPEDEVSGKDSTCGDVTSVEFSIDYFKK